MAKKIRVWDGTAWQDVAPSLPYTAIHSAQASMPLTGVDGQVWLDTDGTLAGQDFVPLSGGTMTGNLNVPSINSGPIVGRNKVLNGDFSIWQRGTSFTNPANSTLTSDRWYVGYDGTMSHTISQQSFTPGNEIPGYESPYYLRWNVTSVSGTTGRYLWQKIEDVRTLAGQTVTFSFWAKASTPVTLWSSIGNQSFGSGGSAFNGGISQANTLTTSWQRFTQTATISSVYGKTIGTGSYLEAAFAVSAVTGIIDIWGVQLESGNKATPFHTATPNQQTELAACQRYYYRINAEHTYGILCSVGYANTTSQWYGRAQHPVPMRIAPSSMEYGGTFRLTDGPAGYTTSVVSLAGVNNKYYTEIAASTSGMTQYRTVYLQGSNDANSYIAFSAEL